MKRLVVEGKFREDLYFRLNVIELRIPPLRERIQDIPVLLKTFIHKYNNLMSKQVVGITDAALEALQQYNWPGNIRELENTVERILNYKGNGLIDVHDLPEEFIQVKPIRQTEEIFSKPVLSLNTIEIKAIEAALKHANGNKSKAARLLGISRSKLYEKLATNLEEANLSY